MNSLNSSNSGRTFEKTRLLTFCSVFRSTIANGALNTRSNLDKSAFQDVFQWICIAGSDNST